MRFMMFLKGNRSAEGPAPSPEVVAAMGTYNEELVKAGALLAAEGLHPTSKGALVRFSGVKPTVTDGPFTEAKEVIFGFWMIEVNSKEQALEWARRCPATEAEIELRQVFEASDFAPEVFTPEEAARAQAVRDQIEKKSAGR